MDSITKACDLLVSVLVNDGGKLSAVTFECLSLAVEVLEQIEITEHQASRDS